MSQAQQTLPEEIKEIKDFMKGAHFILYADINTFPSKSRPWIIDERYRHTNMSAFDLHQVLKGLEEAEIFVGHLGAEGHVCGWEPRYSSLLLAIRKIGNNNYILYAVWGNITWHSEISALITTDEAVAWLSALCDGTVALRIVRDILRLELGADPCRDEFEIISPSSAYCRFSDP